MGSGTTVRYPARERLAGAAMMAIVGLAALGTSVKKMRRYSISGKRMA